MQGRVHIWDSGNIIADIGTTETVYYIRVLTLIYAKKGEIKTYYRFNGHGDVIALANSSGAIIKRYKYDSFGVEENPGIFDTNVFRYCGEYYDIETKTIYLRARYYDAETGRFTQQDGWEYAEAGDVLSLNLYTYCGNDPVSYVDPSGHSFKLGLALGGIKAVRKLVRAAYKSYKVGGGETWSYYVKAAVEGLIDGFCDGLLWKPIRSAKRSFASVWVGAFGKGVNQFIGTMIDKIEEKGFSFSTEDFKEAALNGLKDMFKGFFEGLKNLAIDKLIESMQVVNEWLVSVFDYIDQSGLIDRKYIDAIRNFITCDLSDETKQKIQELIS